MKLKRIFGKGKQGLDLSIDILEQQQIAAWRDDLAQFAHPRIKRITVEFDEDHVDIKNKSFDYEAEAERLDNLLVDVLNPADGLPCFLNNLVDGVGSPQQVLGGLTKPYKYDIDIS